MSSVERISADLNEELRANDVEPDPGPLVLQLPHGFHRNVPEAVYHRPVLGLASKSGLDDVRHSPLHYLERVTKGSRAPTPALVFGAAFHCALLEPAEYRTLYAVEPDFGDCRKTANKTAREAWRKAHAGRRLLDRDDADSIANMCAKVRRHPVAKQLLSGGAAEVTMRWQDPETGLECKGRLDFLLDDRPIALDVKTTDDVRARAFARTVANYGYHRQEAMYRDACAILGRPLTHFAFIAVEKEAPHDVTVNVLDADAVVRGRSSIREDMNLLASCIEKDHWPGTSEHVQTLSLPSWSE